MTECEWFACTDPQKMLTFLRGKASGRKMRLLACGCCRRIWHLLSDEFTRPAVEIAERYTDGLVSESDWDKLHYALWNHHGTLEDHPAASITVGAVLATIAPYISNGYHRLISFGVYNACRAAAYVFNEETGEFDSSDDCTSRMVCEEVKQSELIRDIFGNPFQPSPLNPPFLTATVKAIARTVYEDRRFEHLPILADALEESGCSDEDILQHCRHPGEHVRGCWVLDLILNKE